MPRPFAAAAAAAVAAAAASFALTATVAAAVGDAPDPREFFEDYKKRFGKVYDSQAEEAKRFGIFNSTIERVNELNKLNGEPIFGFTWMSDRAPEESYKRGRKGHGDVRFIHTAPVHSPSPQQRGEGLPSNIDWRKTNAVTAVKNQGQCGSCWAFSAAEEVESQWALQVSEDYAILLSPQQVNSCVEACDGCGGGDTVTAYEYLKGSPGLANEFFWPYAQGLTPLDQCTSKACTQSCSSHDLSMLSTYEFYIGQAAHVTGFKYATPPCEGACTNQNLDLLASAVANEGPVSVCVNAGVWNDYWGGVLTAEACGSMADEDIDHCVQLVGYNTESVMPYWIVRNSWANSWGMEGYIYLEKNKNTCGLANEATIVTLSSSSPASERASRFSRLRERALGGNGVRGGEASPLLV